MDDTARGEGLYVAYVTWHHFDGKNTRTCFEMVHFTGSHQKSESCGKYKIINNYQKQTL